MSAHPKLVIALLILSGLLLVGCEGAVPVATTAGCEADYSRLLERSWRLYRMTNLPAYRENDRDVGQTIVLYRVEAQQVDPVSVGYPRGIEPVFGLVCRRDRNRPLDIHAYPLKLPADMYLGERDVNARWDDVLSGANSDPNGKSPQELVIEDKDASGLIVQASIFNYREDTASENSEYVPKGVFKGDAGVTVEKDKVTVLERWWQVPRSQLAQRKVYVPRKEKDKENQTYWRDDNGNALVDPETIDLVPLVMPNEDNLQAAEYQEKLVLRFYQLVPMSITDTNKLTNLFSPDVLEQYRTRDDKALGCLANRQLSQVYVQSLDISKSDGIPLHIENENKQQVDQVVITARCRFSSESKLSDRQSVVTWEVRWNWTVDQRTGKWRIIKATVNSEKEVK